MGCACSAYGGERRGVYRVLVGKPEGKRPLGNTGLSLVLWGQIDTLD